MYGSQLWDLTNQNINAMCTQWRKKHRRILSVSNRTHCDLLPLISDNIPLEVKLDCKFIGFYKSIASSENSLVRYAAKCKMYDYSSTFGRNMTHLIHKYELQVDDMLALSKNMIKKHCYNRWINQIKEEYITYSLIIKDMIKMKENRCVRYFSDTDCNFIIGFLCTI